MNTIVIPEEQDLKKFLKEVLQEFFTEHSLGTLSTAIDEALLSRQDIANFLEISLVTLHAWMKKGLPFHKQPGKVYFLKSEVLEYIKMKAPVRMLAGALENNKGAAFK